MNWHAILGGVIGGLVGGFGGFICGATLSDRKSRDDFGFGSAIHGLAAAAICGPVGAIVGASIATR